MIFCWECVVNSEYFFTALSYTGAPCLGFPNFRTRDSPILVPNCDFEEFRAENQANPGFKISCFETRVLAFCREFPDISGERNEIRVNIIIRVIMY